MVKIEDGERVECDHCGHRVPARNPGPYAAHPEHWPLVAVHEQAIRRHKIRFFCSWTCVSRYATQEAS